LSDEIAEKVFEAVEETEKGGEGEKKEENP